MIASVWRPDSTLSTTCPCTPRKDAKQKVECRMERESTATYNLPFPEQMVTPTGIEPEVPPKECRVLTARRRGRAMRQIGREACRASVGQAVEIAVVAVRARKK